MAEAKRVRGPRLSSKLLLLSVVLLAVPWLSYHQLYEMEKLLLQGQQNAQLLMARGIAVLLNDRSDLFEELPVQLEEYESIYALPLYETVRIDGSDADWDEEVANTSLSFRNEGEVDASFELYLGEQVNELYGFMQIKDDVAIYRDLNQLELSTADQIRLTYTDTKGELAHIAWTFSEPGVATVYEMSSNWREPTSWTPLTDVLGFVNKTDLGYDFEFRFPISRLSDGRDFSLSFVDVDDLDSRLPRNVTRTEASTLDKDLNLVVLRSVEAMNLIESLGFLESKVILYDSNHRIRGESQLQPSQSKPAVEHLTWVNRFEIVRPILHFLTTGETWTELSVQESKQLETNLINDAIDDRPGAIRRIDESGARVVLATYPIRSSNEVIGAVSVEADISQILSFQYAALREVVFVSFITLAVVLIVAVGFSGRLAYRIRRLRRETSGAIDDVGRLAQSSLKAEVRSADEIGDLARSIDDMLSRLKEHGAFLARMPRTLRHEINNPLNTLSTSLESIDKASDASEREEYLASAKRGVQRISAIVQNLADAASLEESLQKEELVPMNLTQLLQNYTSNLNLHEDEELFVFRGPNEQAMLLGSDIYIEQMLDKVVDNAVDFHEPGTQILIQMDCSRDQLRLVVANRGPSLGDNTHLLFERLVSHREGKSASHFGLGLYVVRVIAEYHGGSAKAVDLHDQTGVIFSIEMPRYVSQQAKAA